MTPAAVVSLALFTRRQNIDSLLTLLSSPDANELASLRRSWSESLERENIICRLESFYGNAEFFSEALVLLISGGFYSGIDASNVLGGNWNSYSD